MTGLRPPFFAAATSSGASGTAAGARRRTAEAGEESSKVPRTANAEDVSQVTALAPAPVNLEAEMEDLIDLENTTEPVFNGGIATAEGQAPPVTSTGSWNIVPNHADANPNGIASTLVNGPRTTAFDEVQWPQQIVPSMAEAYSLDMDTGVAPLRDVSQDIPPIQHVTNIQNNYGVDQGPANEQFAIMTSAILGAASATISDERQLMVLQTVVFVEAIENEVKQQAIQYAQNEADKMNAQHNRVIAHYENVVANLNTSLSQTQLQLQGSNNEIQRVKKYSRK